MQCRLRLEATFEPVYSAKVEDFHASLTHCLRACAAPPLTDVLFVGFSDAEELAAGAEDD